MTGNNFVKIYRDIVVAYTETWNYSKHKIAMNREKAVMSELKSSYEIALARIKGMGIDESASLTEEQKQRIAEIKRECEAKTAEKKILLKGAEELAEDLRRLEMRRDEKIQAVYRETHDPGK